MFPALRSRRAAGLALLACSLLALLALSGVLRRGQRFSALCVDETAWQALAAQRSEAPAPLLTSLRFGEHALFLDAEAQCFYYSLIEGDAAALDPAVRWQGARGVRVAFAPGGLAAGGETELLAYTDTACTRYRLCCTTLPLIDISGPDPDTLVGADRTPQAMHFRLFDNRAGATQRVITAAGDIHVRGQTTAAYPKKGFRLHLLQESPGNSLREYDWPLLGLRADGDWLLYAAYNDPEKVRNVFSSDLWFASCAQNNGFGVVNGMEYRYVELFLNGRYWGLYALGYPLDAAQLGLQTNSAGLYTEYCFQKMTWDPSESDPAFREQYPMPGYELTLPVFHEPTAWDALRNYYRALYAAQQPADLYGLADMGSAIDLYLFYELIQSCDAAAGHLLKNVFVTMKNSGDGQLALYTPWDMDRTWGNGQGAGLPYPYELSPDTDCWMEPNPVHRLLQMGDADTAAAVQARYAALRAGPWREDALLAMLDGLEADIFASGAFARDTARWPDGAHADPARGLADLRAYVRARLQAMDASIAALA